MNIESEASYPGAVVLRRLLRYSQLYWPYFLLGLFGFALNAAAENGAVQVIKFITDALSSHDSRARFWIPLLVIALVFVRGLGSFVGNYYISLVARNIVYRLRLEMFNKLLTLPASYYHLNSSARIASKILYDVEQVTSAATDAVISIAREGFTTIAYLSLLFWYNWRLSLLIILIGPLIGKVVQLASQRFRRLSHRIQGSMGDINHISNETIQGYNVVKSFGGEAYERQRFERASNEYLRQTMKMVVTSSINTPVVQLIIALAMSFIVWLALGPGLTGFHSAGEFIAYFTAAGLLAKPVRALTDVNQKVQRGIAASQSVFALIDLPEEDDSGELAPATVKGDLVFRDVSFAYHDHEWVLQDISFTVKAGQTVAIVGRSGAGKSTLVNLLPRFYETTRGQILLDAVPLEHYRLHALRRYVATVSQKVMLFNDTVRGNIAYGAYADCSREEVEMACAAAYAHDFIMALPQGYDTPIGQDGVQLSGGQRQRLAIARAILKNAPLLILDEATSALDNESEFYIQRALESIMRERTTLVIAHRLSTIENADLILVMDQGRLIEQGTHAELLALGGMYKQLHSRNFADMEEGPG
ncbi:MAG: lipid A export permease/ATP-binding protein MsbA [Pseudomonadales bacterium]|nr:lipid A export permease/ATP-binding protein MsbA [Pseudomonadales bacterium]